MLPTGGELPELPLTHKRIDVKGRPPFLAVAVLDEGARQVAHLGNKC